MPQKGIFGQTANWTGRNGCNGFTRQKALRTDHIELCCHFKTHVHLLVFDAEGRNVIPQSIKLIAGRTSQEYNSRKNRKAAFWEERYHATAVESEQHLARRLACIDINIVCVGVVSHPSE
jgi:hypothetical protein